MNFENGVTATLTMHGFSHEEGRSIRIDGTKGTLVGEFTLSKHHLVFFDHLSQKKRVIIDRSAAKGHGGGDIKLIEAFVDSIDRVQDNVATSIIESMTSHAMAFAADTARIEKRVVVYPEFIKV